MLYDEGKVGLPLADSVSSFITLGKSGHVRELLGGLSDRTSVKNLSQCLEQRYLIHYMVDITILMKTEGK